MNKYLTINRIEFAVTYCCNGRCRHCYSKNTNRFPAHIDASLAVNIVKNIGKTYHPQSIMTFGGEPLLFPEIVCAIHKEATKVEIPSREIITNGYWSMDANHIRKIAKDLAESGVNNIQISVDAFHQEYIPLSVVRKTAQACIDMHIKTVWNPCWVISRGDNNSYNRKTRLILKTLKDLLIPQSEGDILEPGGLALVNLKEFFPPRKEIPAGACGDIPYTTPLDAATCIYIEPDGRIAVCKRFYIGNAFETDIIRIIEDYNPFKIPEMRVLLNDGVKGLVEWAQKRGVEPDPKGYYSVCHLCRDIREKARNK